jgi:1,4-dihydroxy-2-naphthoate octaprenyltransferase
VPPKQVLIATYVAFGLAVLVGVYLIVTAGWQILAIGAASILAGVLYTGGPKPYGYEGLGEVFVFLFFGVAASPAPTSPREKSGRGSRSRSPSRSACSPSRS